MLGLVTAEAAVDLDPDLRPLADALVERCGEESVRVVSWDDASVDWAEFDAVVIRSTWDYVDRLDEFHGWVDRVSATTRLVNEPSLVRWSTDKHYLVDLAAEGVPITPTAFVAPGEPVPELGSAVPGLVGADDVMVVKPTVGAGSSGARRCVGDEVADHVRLLHGEGRTAMVQPYLRGLDEHGETALCFVADVSGELELSHAFRKGPILSTTEVEQVGDLFAKEDIAPRHPTPAEVDLGRRAVATDAVRRHGRPVFARVDLAPHGSGGREDPHSLVVVELELVEPSFYFECDAASPARFADGVLGALSLGHGTAR